MPKAPPPATCPGLPVLCTLPQGAVLFRVHSARFGPVAFNPTAADDSLRGGRFDSSDGSYAYLYAAATREVALAEVLVRDLPVHGPARIIPRATLSGRLLTKVEARVHLTIVSLEGPDLGHVGQDAWLTKCDASDYVTTRAWSAAIRRWAPTAAGFVWRSKRDERSHACVLFEDRLPAADALVKSGRSLKLDRGPGLAVVRGVLARHNATLDP